MDRRREGRGGAPASAYSIAAYLTNISAAAFAAAYVAAGAKVGVTFAERLLEFTRMDPLTPLSFIAAATAWMPKRTDLVLRAKLASKVSSSTSDSSLNGPPPVLAPSRTTDVMSV